MRRRGDRADPAAPAGVRPFLLFHFDIHGRPSALAFGATAKGIEDDAQPPRFHSDCGGDGRLAGMERKGASLARVVAGERRSSTRRRRVGRSRRAQRHPVDPPAVRRCEAAPADRRSCRGRGVKRVVAHAPAPVSDAADWTTRVLVGGLKPARTLLVPIHRCRRKRQPHRPHHHRTAPQRSATRELRLRQLPGRQRKQAQCLSPDDLRG